MTNYRGTITQGFFVVAAVATAHQAMAQEPWVGPGPGENTGNTVVVAPVVVQPVVVTEVSADTGAKNTTLDHYMPPVHRAFELQLSGGVGIPFGKTIIDFANAHPTLSDIADPGATLVLSLGFRANRRWMFGVYGTGSRFGRGALADSSTDIWAATAGIQADYHFRSSYGIDPFLSVSTGGSGFWVSSSRASTVSLLGWEMGRVAFGVDFRITRQFALAPVVSGATTLFLTRSGANTDGFTNIDPRANVYLFGGLMGRFDFGKSGSSSAYGQVESHTETF